MLSRLTLRARLTLLHTGVFLAVSVVVLTMVYVQNRVVILELDAVLRPGEEMRSTSGGAAVPAPPGVRSGLAIQKNHALTTLLSQWIVALAVMTVIVGLLGWWVTGRVLNRVHQMTAQARRISTVNLHERIAVQGPEDEIKELSDTFDALLARLDDTFHSQRRFIANAAHELRTPLAVARTTLQVGLASTNPDRVSRVREELLRNNDRCVALINGLLTLARGEQGLHRRETVELDTIARHVITELTATDPVDAPRLRLDAPTRCTVLGDPLLLGQLVHNLADNAMRYNVPDGDVLIEVAARGCLTISNTGPVIADDETEALFEPFHRGSAERTGRTDGAGLGLSIVRAIASVHDGQVTARPRNGGGLIVEVTIPATQVTTAEARRVQGPGFRP